MSRLKCLLCNRSHCCAENRCVGRGLNEGLGLRDTCPEAQHAVIHMGYDSGDFDQGGSNRSNIKWWDLRYNGNLDPTWLLLVALIKGILKALKGQITVLNHWI